MVDPRYYISCLDKDLLHFLKYMHIGHRSDDIIPLALLQFRLTIMIDEEEIHDIFIQYDTPDGIIHPLLKGHCVRLVLGSLYA